MTMIGVAVYILPAQAHQPDSTMLLPRPSVCTTSRVNVLKLKWIELVLPAHTHPCAGGGVAGMGFGERIACKACSV